MFFKCLTVLAMLMAPSLPAAAQMSKSVIDAAEYDGGALPEGQSPLTMKVQILLDRAGISPGVIDGYSGGMTATALRQFEALFTADADGRLDPETWRLLLAAGGERPVMQHVTLSESDIPRVVGDLPVDYARLAQRDWLGFESAAEGLAERFHMDVEVLRQMNPRSRFAAGETILVAAPGADMSGKVARIEIDRDDRRLAAFDAEGNQLANYPVGVGSEQTPSPSGTMPVSAIAVEPTYHYRPDENFQQMDNTEPLTLPPGPNGPVGIVWIDLDRPTYGIHGTPDPARLFSEYSHGCVRMTNWDALELVEMVEPGTTIVEFK